MLKWAYISLACGSNTSTHLKRLEDILSLTTRVETAAFPIITEERMVIFLLKTSIR